MIETKYQVVEAMLIALQERYDRESQSLFLSLQSEHRRARNRSPNGIFLQEGCSQRCGDVTLSYHQALTLKRYIKSILSGLDARVDRAYVNWVSMLCDYFNALFRQRVSAIVRCKKALASNIEEEVEVKTLESIEQKIRSEGGGGQDLLDAYAPIFSFDEQVQKFGCYRDRIVRDYCEVAQLDCEQLFSRVDASVTCG